MTALSERYFRPKAFELDGRLYRWLGVVAFKRALMRSVQVDPERRPSNAYVLGGVGLEHIRSFERQSRRSEVIHLLGLLMAVVFLVFGVWAQSLLVAGAVVFGANFHCYLLQRYNRARIYRVLGRRVTSA